MGIIKDSKNASGIRIDSLQRGRKIVFFVNGHSTTAYMGETIHAALIAAGYCQFRKSKTCQPRGVFCGMGVCYECLVTVNNGSIQRACMTVVEEGMEVEIDGD
ncbi:(2Fe-2S)-binding protein [Desulfococcaceae bacterium HSG7]|nr:(2Fe-2S)-binding protein [Desulfococcaceae bacterium HSG7]